MQAWDLAGAARLARLADFASGPGPHLLWEALTPAQQSELIMLDLGGELRQPSPCLHRGTDQHPHLLDLPQHILLLVMSHLGANDLCRLGRAAAELWRGATSSGIMDCGGVPELVLLQQGARMAV